MRRWAKGTRKIIANSWKQRSMITNVIFCLYLLSTILLSLFIFSFSYRSLVFSEVSIGFYAISFLYCIYQYFLNRRDGVYAVVLSVLIVVAVGVLCFGSKAYRLYDSTQLLFLYSIPIICSLAFRKNHKSTWQHLDGGLYGLLKWRRHILFYLFCILWICLVIYKTQIAQSGY